MASFLGRRATASAWTVEEAALFAARKEVELLKLLAEDRKLLALAARLQRVSVPRKAPCGTKGSSSDAGRGGAGTAVQKRWKRSSGERRARQAAARTIQRFRRALLVRRRWRGAVAAALAVARAAPAAAQQHIQPMEEDADPAPTLLGKRPSAGSGGRVDAVRTRAAAASPSSSPGGRRAAPSSRASPSPHPPGPLPAGPPALAAPARREQGAGQPPAGCGSTPGRDALLAREMVMPAAPADGAAALAPARGGASSLV